MAIKKENYGTVGEYVNALANRERATSPLDDALKKHYNPNYISVYDEVNPQGFFRFNEPKREALYNALTPSFQALADEGIPNTEEKYNEASVMLNEVLGMDLKEARRVAPFIYPQIAERDMNKHSWGSQFGRQIANAFYGDMNGHAMTMYVLTGNKYWKERADKMYNEQLKLRNWQDYGWFGNLGLEQAQGLYSWGSFLLPSLLTGGIGGAVGLSAKAINGITMGLEVVQSGSSQMGANAYLMTKMTDEQGNALLDVDNMTSGEKAIYLGAMGLMGGIEVGLMEGITGLPTKVRGQISREFAKEIVEKSIQDTLKQYMAKGLKGWAISSVKDIMGEGLEEFTQQIVGNAFENYEAKVQNKRGANFKGYDKQHLFDGVWESFKGGVRGSLLVGMLGSAYTTRWNDKNTKVAEQQVNKYQNIAQNGSIIDTSVIVNKEEFTTKQKADYIQRHTDNKGNINLPVANVEANGVATFKPSTSEDALIIESVKELNGKGNIAPIKVNYESDMTFNLSTLENKVALANAIGGEVSREDNNTIVFRSEDDLNNGLIRLKSEYNVKETAITVDGEGTTIHLINTDGEEVAVNLVSDDDGKIATVDVNVYKGDSVIGPLTEEQLKLTEEEDKTLDDYMQLTLKTKGEDVATDEKPQRREFSERETKAVKRAVNIVYKQLQNSNKNLEMNDVLNALEIKFTNDDAIGKIDIVEQGEGKLKKGVIHITEDATPKVLIHEIGHFLRANASEEELRGYRRAYGIDGSKQEEWAKPVSKALRRQRGITNASANYTYEELFANDFVRYVERGYLPSEEMGSVFGTLKAMLVNIVDNFKGRLNSKTYNALRETFKGNIAQRQSTLSRLGIDIKRAERVLNDTSLTEEQRKKWQEYRAKKETARDYLLKERERRERNLGDTTTLNFTNDNDLDNKGKEDLNNGYERTNEFRRIQAESKRLLEELEHSTRAYRHLDEGMRGRYTGYIQDQLRTIKRRSSDVNEFNLTNAKGTSFILYSGVPPVLFHDAFETIKPYVVQNELVDLHEDYSNAKCYLSSDGLQGFAIENDGNLISVFNADINKRGYIGAIKDFIKEQGATHLDCYGYLAEKYNKYFGFKTASLMDYNMEYDHHNIAENYNNPQIAFMVNTSEDVETRHFNKDDYDGAKDYQMSFVGNAPKTFYYTEEEASDVIDALTDEEAINLVGNAKSKGYLIPLRLAERTGDIDTLNEYAELDNFKLLNGVDYVAKARDFIENLDIKANEETADSNIREVLDKAKEQFVAENTTEDTGEDTKNIMRFAFAIAEIERSADKDKAFLLQHSGTKEQIIDLVNTILKREVRGLDGRTQTEIRSSGAFMLDEELKDVSKNTTAREIKKIQKIIEKRASEYRQEYEKALRERNTDTAENERQAYYDLFGDANIGVVSRDDVGTSEVVYSAEDLKATEQTNQRALDSISKELKRLGIKDNASIEAIQTRITEISNELKEINKDVSEATKQERAIEKGKREAQKDKYENKITDLKEKQKEKLEKQKARYERALVVLKEKRQAEKQRRALTKEKKTFKKLLKFNNTTTDSDYEGGVLWLKDRLGAYKDEAEYSKDYKIRSAIASRLGVNVEDAPGQLSMLLSMADIDVDNFNGSLGELVRLNEVLKEYKAQGRAVLQQREMSRREKLFNTRLAMFKQNFDETLDLKFEDEDSIKKLNTAIAQTETVNKNKIISGIEAVYNATLHGDNLAHRIDKIDNGVWSNLIEGYKANEKDKLANVITRSTEFGTELKNLGIKEKSLPYWLLDKTDEQGNKWELTINKGDSVELRELTREEAIGLYVYMQNEDGKAKLLDVMGNAFTEDSIDKVINSLDDTSKAFGDLLIKSVGSRWDVIADKFHDVYNGTLAKEENYFPFVGERGVIKGGITNDGAPSINDLSLGSHGSISYVDKGMTYDRTNAIYPLSLKVYGIYLSQLQAQEQFISHAEWVRDMQFYLSDKGMGVALKNKYGKSIVNEMRGLVNDIARPSRIMNDGDKVLGRVLSNVAVSKMMFSATTMIKQIGALGAVLADGNTTFSGFAKAIHEVFTQDKDSMAVMYNYHPQIQEQQGTNLGIDVQRVKESIANTKFEQGVKDFQNYGLLAMEKMDLIIREIVFLTSYNSAIEKGLSTDEAGRTASNLVFATQNNSNVASLSSMQRKTDVFSRAFFAFTNQSFQYWNKIADIPFLLKNKRGREAVGTMLMVCFNTALMLGLSGVLLRPADDKEDKEKKRREIAVRALQDFSNNIPLVSSFSDSLSGYSGGGSLIDFEFMTNTGSIIKRVIQPKNDGKDLDYILDQSLGILGSVGEATVSLPTTQLKRMKKFKREEDDTIQDALYRGFMSLFLGGEFVRNVEGK